MSFNELNPATSSLLISGDMRANFLATRRHMFSANLVGDPLFECWPNSDTTAPAYYLFGGAGASIARSNIVAQIGVGPGPQVQGAQLTAVGATALLDQRILRSVDYDDFFDGQIVTAGCFVHSVTGGAARITVIDSGGPNTNSAFHTGSGVVEFLDLEHLIDPGATELNLRCSVQPGAVATFSGLVFLFSDIKPDRFVMPPMARSSLVLGRGGDAFLGGLPIEFMPQRPFIVEHVQLRTATQGPTGSSLICDVNQWTGGGFTSMFTAGGRPRIVAGEFQGGAAPDGVYNRKCFTGQFGAAPVVAGELLQGEIDAVGSTLPGTDLSMMIRYKTWLRPQEIFAQFDSQGQA